MLEVNIYAVDIFELHDTKLKMNEIYGMRTNDANKRTNKIDLKVGCCCCFLSPSLYLRFELM